MNDEYIYYVDCDPGIDDALALLYLLRTGVDVASIGVVSGNVAVAVAAENTRRLLALAGRQDIPISIGLHHPLVGQFWGGAAEIHGVDGFGGVELSLSETVFDNLSSAARLVELAHRYGTKLRIIALGPLTNIVAAIKQEPALPQMVDTITIMGGAYNAPGNVTAYAEANIYADPYAADQVLTAPWRELLLIPLDITTHHMLTAVDNQRLAASDDPLIRRVSKMIDFYLNACRHKYGGGECALHDPLAAALAIGAMTLSDVRACRLSVETAPAPRLGKTVVSMLDDGQAHQSRTRIALSAEPDLAPLLLETIGC